MDERYLRFPRWLELSGLPQHLVQQLGVEGWLVFRRLVEEDLVTNLIPDWVDLDLPELSMACGLSPEQLLALFQQIGQLKLLHIRRYSENPPTYQYKLAQPLPVPDTTEAICRRLQKARLPDRPELWRYWEQSDTENKYDRLFRLYENACGLRISPRIVEDLVELAETYSFPVLEKGFAEARAEGVTALGWIRKALKRIQKHERVQKNWGRPTGLELPEGFGRPETTD